MARRAIDAFYEQEMGPQLFPAVDELLEEGVFDPIGPGASRLVCLTQLARSTIARWKSHARADRPTGRAPAPLLLPREEADALAPNSRRRHSGRGGSCRCGLIRCWSYRESDVGDELAFLNRERTGKHVE